MRWTRHTNAASSTAILKPSNVVLRPDGTVKVLGFGLAKTQDASKLPSDISASPTKDTRHRMQSAGDVRLELEELDNAVGVAGAPTRTRTPWLILGGAAALFVGAVAMFVLANSTPGVVAPPAPVRVGVQLPQQGPLWFDDGVSVAMSRDGRMLAWVGGSGRAVGPRDRSAGGTSA